MSPSFDHFFSTSLTYETLAAPTDPGAPETVTNIIWSSTGVAGKLRGGETITLTAQIQTSKGRVLPAEFGSVFVAGGGAFGSAIEVRSAQGDTRIVIAIRDGLTVDEGTTWEISGLIVNQST